MNEPLYTSQKDEDRKNLKPVSFEPDSFDFKLRRTVITTQSPVIAFNSQDGATEEDVLNRSAAMQTGYVSPDTSELVRQQVETQNAAIAESKRLAALKTATEEEAARQAEIVKQQQVAAVLEAERLRIMEGEAAAKRYAEAEAQRISDEAVVRRSVGETVIQKPDEAISVDLAYSQDVINQQGGSAQKAAEAAAETVAAEQYIQQQTQKTEAENQAVQQWALKGEAGAADQSGATDLTPAKPAQEAFAEATVVTQRATEIVEQADKVMKETNDKEEFKAAEKTKQEAKNVIKEATIIMQTVKSDDDDIFDKIAKWIIKTVKL